MATLKLSQITTGGTVALGTDTLVGVRSGTTDVLINLPAVAAPQGRLTLQSVTPVQNADQTAKGTIYYDQYNGNLVPNYNGTNDINLTITGGEVSLILDATNHTLGSIYDIFAINNSGAVRLVTGPAWTNTTTRSSAINTTTRGYITNNASLTHAYNNSVDYGPVSANQGTYIGTVYCTANGQTGIAIKPTAASGGTANIMGVYNAYNRVPISIIERDSALWTYATNAWRLAHNSTSNSIAWVDGLGQNSINVVVQNIAVLPASTNYGMGVNIDATTGQPINVSFGLFSTVAATPPIANQASFYPLIGYHTAYAMEFLNASNSSTLNGDGIEYQLIMNTQF